MIAFSFIVLETSTDELSHTHCNHLSTYIFSSEIISFFGKNSRRSHKTFKDILYFYNEIKKYFRYILLLIPIYRVRLNREAGYFTRMS